MTEKLSALEKQASRTVEESTARVVTAKGGMRYIRRVCGSCRKEFMHSIYNQAPVHKWYCDQETKTAKNCWHRIDLPLNLTPEEEERIESHEAKMAVFQGEAHAMRRCASCRLIYYHPKNEVYGTCQTCGLAQ